MGLIAYLGSYLLGGVTLVPLLLVVVMYLSPKVDELAENAGIDTGGMGGDGGDGDLQAGKIEEAETLGLKAYKSGWIMVTQEYLESIEDISSTTQCVSESSESKSAYSSLYKLAKSSDSEQPAVDPLNQPPLEHKGDAGMKKSQKRHRYYAVLKHGNMFLYKNETLKDVKHVVVLSNQIISMWPRNIPDAQLFTKTTAICMMKKDWSRVDGVSNSFDHKQVTIEDVLTKGLTPPTGSIFIYCDINSDKEDWYFSLLRATKTDKESSFLNPLIYAQTLHFDTKDMMELIQTLYSLEGQLHTKWINALIGRLFLSLQKTDFLHELLRTRLDKKLKKIRKPGFLDTFKIVKINTGKSAPFVTWPSLREINPSGDVVVKVYMHYRGHMSFQIATKATINLGSRFKSREVDLLLSITMEKLEGPMLIKFKPPPSARVWYTFENEPVMNLKIEPVISSRQFTYTIITNSIEKKFKEAVKETLVVPQWDDFVLYDTANEIYRGGIWSKNERAADDEKEATQQSDQSSEQTINDKDELQPSTSNVSSRNLPENPTLMSLTNSVTGKSKLSNTISDFSKKMKRTKTLNGVTANDNASVSDVSNFDSIKSLETNELPSRDLNKKTSVAMLKRIGKWYFNDEKQATEADNYNPPEMILSRRQIRKSISDQPKAAPSTSPSSVEMFSRDLNSNLNSDYVYGKFDPVTNSRRSSKLSVESLDRPSSFNESLGKNTSEYLGDGNVSEDFADSQSNMKRNDLSSSDLSSANMKVSSSIASVSPETASVTPDGKSLKNHFTHNMSRKPPPGSPPRTPDTFADDTFDLSDDEISLTKNE